MSVEQKSKVLVAAAAAAMLIHISVEHTMLGLCLLMYFISLRQWWLGGVMVRATDLTGDHGFDSRSGRCQAT